MLLFVVSGALLDIREIGDLSRWYSGVASRTDSNFHDVRGALEQLHVPLIDLLTYAANSPDVPFAKGTYTHTHTHTHTHTIAYRFSPHPRKTKQPSPSSLVKQSLYPSPSYKVRRVVWLKGGQ